MKYFFKNLGENIKYYRETKGKTINEIANITGIRKEYLLKIEKGKAYGMTSTHLFLIAEALAVKPHVLVDFVYEE